MGGRRWWRGVTGALVAGAATASAGACRQTLGLDAYSNGHADASSTPDAPSDLDGSAACGLSFGTTPCAACAASHCCDLSSQCAQDPQCSNCVGACGGDAGCQGTCLTQAKSFVVDPAQTGAGLAACIAQSCRDECNVSCGAMAAYLSPPALASACEGCLAPIACSAERACAASADCQEYAQCLHACFTPDCREHCVALHDAGAPLFAKVAAAATGNSCAATCGYGQDWTCLGHVLWPDSNATTTDLRFVVDEFGTDVPISAASVSLCSSVSQSATCVSPLAQGQTDRDGSVDLSVRTDTLSTAPMGLQPQLLLTAFGDSPTFLDLAFPLSQQVFTFPPSLSLLFPSSFYNLAATGPPVMGPPGGGPPTGASDAGSSMMTAQIAQAELIVYTVDCQGNPATGVSVTAATASLGCAFGGNCPSTTNSSPSQPGILTFRVPSGETTVTVSVVAPASVVDAASPGLPCCTPALLGGPDSGSTPPPGGSVTDAGIPCYFGFGVDAGCAPICSMDPGCVPAVPPLLDGGQIGSFTVQLPDWAVTGVWVVPQPRAM